MTDQQKVLDTKPNWRDIPKNHEWLCQDENGRWWSFDSKPKVNLIKRWWGLDGPGESEFHGKSETNPNWRNTLEKRP